MEIYVLVKQVPDPEAIVRVKSDTELDIENKYFTSFFDEIAVETGMKLKEKFGGKVTVLTVDNRKVDALRRGISMGADEAIQITDPALEGSDLFSIAKALAAFFRGKTFDLIFAGRQAMDDDAGIVGPAVAEILGIPHVNSIVGLEVDDQKKEAKIVRDVENGKEILTCSLPALFTCQKGLNIPRIPQVMNVMKAMKAQIKKVDLSSLGLSPSEVGSQAAKMKVRKYFPPPKRPPVKMIKEDFPENVKTLVKLLREEAKVL
ncbi:MAG TPA: electron transfer flavoprotein subunit beta/FixA family protein [Thermodesulfobacteriota bacterium]|nr:electron transfer flavoprotein subunit beta/FixA family protein [Thermodesulfobacteriota bacterium]